MESITLYSNLLYYIEKTNTSNIEYEQDPIINRERVLNNEKFFLLCKSAEINKKEVQPTARECFYFFFLPNYHI